MKKLRLGDIVVGVIAGVITVAAIIGLGGIAHGDTTTDAILADIGVVQGQTIAAQHVILGQAPDKATILADFATAQTALTDAVTLSSGYNFNATLHETVDPSPINLTPGEVVSYQFVGAGGTAPYTYQLQDGIIPAGLTISSSGLVSGTVLAASGLSANGVIVLQDSAGGSYQFAYWFKVN